MKYTSTFDDNSIEAQDAKKVGEQAADQVESLVSTALIQGVAVLIESALLGLLVTNYHERSLKGDKTLSPTKDETSLDSKETSAAHQESKLSHDEFKAQEGNLAGVNTDANVAVSSTDATSADVAAAKTEAGTIDTSATALQIN